LAFALEALGSNGQRAELLGAFHDWCNELSELDPDGDAVSNAEDCAPLDPEVWAVPAPATDLRLRREPPNDLVWQAAAPAGGDQPIYDVLRSYTPSDFSAASCVASGISATAASDPTLPDEGKMAAYLVRARNVCGAAMGSDSTGQPRVEGPACP
jgi:hypothetical protein